jgi:NifB/MoaA-like Fe-S oxidoreductase
MVGILDMANYDLNNYLRQMDSFRAADHARENLVNVSYTSGKGTREAPTYQCRNLLRSSQVSYGNRLS